MSTLAQHPSKRAQVYTRIKRDLWEIIRKEAWDKQSSITQVLDDIVRGALIKQTHKRSA